MTKHSLTISKVLSNAYYDNKAANNKEVSNDKNVDNNRKPNNDKDLAPSTTSFGFFALSFTFFGLTFPDPTSSGLSTPNLTSLGLEVGNANDKIFSNNENEEELILASEKAK